MISLVAQSATDYHTGFIRQQMLCLQTFNQWQGLGAVGNDAFGYYHFYRHPVGIYRHMQFAVQPPFVRATA